MCYHHLDKQRIIILPVFRIECVYNFEKKRNKFNMSENKVRRRIFVSKKNVGIAECCITIAMKKLLWFGLLSVGQMALCVTIMSNGEFGRVWK